MRPLDYKLGIGVKCELCSEYATVVVTHKVTAAHHARPHRRNGKPVVVVTAGHSHTYCHEHCPAHVRPDVGAAVETCPLPAVVRTASEGAGRAP